jgi:urease accessory protein
MPTTTERVASPADRALGTAAAASALPLLRLLWLSSPALPIGAYAYSRGLEQAAARGWVHDEASLERWLSGVLRRQLATLDAPVMLRVSRAATRQDVAGIASWNEFLLAHRESREFALEDTQLGASLARLLRELAGPVAGLLPERPAHATVFGLAAAHYAIAEQAALGAYLFSFAENQITAALKCLSLGQTAGQRLLSRLVEGLGALAQEAWERSDAELGSFAPGLALASALHETQYTRLFRS